MLPRTKINFRYFGWFFFRVFSGEFWLPAWMVIAFWFVLDLVPLVLHLSSKGGGDGVALGAHVGGTVAGTLAMLAMRRSLGPSPSDTPRGKLPVRRLSPATAPSREPATIYVSIDGQQVGPYAPSQVRAMVALGSLPPEAYYWQEGMTEWRLLSEL